jgi:signal peptidase I
MYINGGSMAPFFNPNASPDLPETKDKILVQFSNFTPLPTVTESAEDTGRIRGTTIHRGQIVVFKTPHDPYKIAVKRIVGIPGDRIQPLQGYKGGDEPVVVQYNHVWVEGDIDNRDKSMDSNWYGPISQHLILGKAILLLEPWYKPTVIRVEEHTYPAKVKGRVQENAVKDALLTPDELERSNAFADGRVLRDLNMLTGDFDATVAMIQSSEERRSKAIILYRGAHKELQRADPKTIGLAKDLIDALENTLVKVGFELDDLRQAVAGKGTEIRNRELEKEMQREDPFMQVGSLPDHALPERVVEEGPAARALREKLERNRKDRAEGKPNGLDDDERHGLWREQDRLIKENNERVEEEGMKKAVERWRAKEE